MGAAGTRHSPGPLFSGRRTHARLGRSAPRECGVASEIVWLFENGIGGKLMECERALLYDVPSHPGTENHRRLLERKPLTPIQNPTPPLMFPPSLYAIAHNTLTHPPLS